MFFAIKFQETSGAPFKADKNGNFPFIGTLIAGKAKSTIINGTIFKRDGLSTGKVYLAQNTERDFEREDGTTVKQHEVQIVSEMSPMDIINSVATLGAPLLITNKANEEVEEEEEVEADNLV